MPRRREVPTDSELLLDLGLRSGRITAEPESPMARFGAWVEADIPEDEELRDVLLSAYAELSEYEQFLCDAILWERLSYAQAAERIGRSKSQAFRLKNQAMQKLRELLEGNEVVQRHLDRT